MLELRVVRVWGGGGTRPYLSAFSVCSRGAGGSRGAATEFCGPAGRSFSLLGPPAEAFLLTGSSFAFPSLLLGGSAVFLDVFSEGD